MLSKILEAVQTSSAIRSVARLLPTAPGSRVMPPTFADTGRASGEKRSGHLFEDRVGPSGDAVKAVLLDSVGSSANRVEEALLDAVREGTLTLPDLILEVPGYGELSTLELPHRVFDAYLREGLLDGEPFLESDLGRRLGAATPRAATAIFEYAPVSLLCGVWDSHGDKGGLGSRFARVLCAELVGLGVVEGRRSAQKTDPRVERPGEVPAFRPADDSTSFTLDPDRAKKDGKGNPVQVKLSELGFGAVPAGDQHGGVTLEHAEQHVVISLGQLRRLRFPDGDTDDEERNRAGRAVLATLGILGIELQRDRGFSLRSGCELSLETEPPWEIVGRTLDDVRVLDVGGSDGARLLFEEAVEHAAETGLRFAKPLRLVARDELVALVKKARGDS